MSAHGSRLLKASAVVLLALGSTACVDPQTLGTLRGVITPSVLLDDPGVRDLAARSATYAKSWAAAATVIALLWLHLRLRTGDREVLVPFILHVTLGYVLLAPTFNDALFWPRAAVKVGRDVAELYPVTDWLVYGGATPTTPNLGLPGFARTGWAGVGALRARVAEGGDRRDPQFLQAEALAQFLGSPPGAVLVVLATVGSYISAVALQVMQATGLAILAVLFPIVTPLVILPWTRGLFWGYLRWFVALLLWGAMFRIVDAVMLSVQLRSLTEPLAAATHADAWALAQLLPNFLVAGVVVHLAFFGMQFMAPGLAYSLVHGVAQRSLRS